MDAKPHRPTRQSAAQASRNENLPLNSSASIPKQLDSQAVYPSHMNGGNFKAATKRSAFGDLSNTSHYAHQSVPAHGIVKPLQPTSKQSLKMAPPKGQDKENAALALAVKNGKSKAAFLHPPQRPANGVRTVSNVHAPSQNDNRAQSIVKQTGAKKMAAVYRDAQQQKPQTLSRKYTSQPQLKSYEAPKLRRAHSKNFTHTAEGDYMEVAYQDALKGLPRQVSEASVWKQHPAAPRIAADTESLQRMPPSPPQPLLAEHDECWDEDEDEVLYVDDEQYDEVGYTTTHSYKSYGDNTTGVISLVPPKRTKKVLKELEQARLYVEEFLSLEELDDESWDITLVSEYSEEIFEYMRTLEERMIPNARYMEDVQVDMHWSMRSILMDWLVQVHNRFSLLPETLFLTVNLIDRFLSHKTISLGKLQLVGATAIFVAAKYEEINCPSVQEIVFMVDNGFSTDEILKAERFMLTMLDFELGCPGPMSFLRRISKADDYDLETRTLAKYFLEVTIMDERFVGCTGSYIAAGAHGLARAILKKGDWVSRDPLFGASVDNQKLKSLWSLTHVHFSGYTWAQLKPLVAMILECCQMAQKHHSAVYEKYTDRRFKKSSIFVQEELAKGFRLPFQNSIPRLSMCSLATEHSAQIRFPPHPDNDGSLIAVES